MSDIDQLIERSSVGQALASLNTWRAFGRSLMQKRKAAGLTMGDISDRSGLSVVRVSAIERAQSPACTDAELTAYCRALDIEKPELPTERLEP